MKDRLENAVASLGSDAAPTQGWERRVNARIRRGQFVRDGVLVLLLLLAVWCASGLGPAAARRIFGSETAPPATLPLVFADRPQQPVTTLAVLLDCTEDRRVLSMLSTQNHLELFQVERRSERGELWIMILDGDVDRRSLDSWEREPWLVPFGWARQAFEHFHFTIGTGCVLGDRLQEAIQL